MTPNEQCLWDLGNEVVRLRQILSPGSKMPDLDRFLEDLLELVNKIRILGYSKSKQFPKHSCQKEEGYLKISCFSSELMGPESLWCSVERKTGGKDDFSHGFEPSFCPICGFKPEIKV